MDKPRALVVRALAGEPISAVGVQHLFKLTGPDTGDRLGVAHFTVPAGVVGAGPHIHHGHDETFYVLSGELTVATDDGEIAVLPGDLAYAPRGSVHGFRNAGETACEALCLYTPPGYEQYFRDVHDAVSKGSELSPELISELRQRYATEAAD
jgi:mannose-6-phosphate isomerase-like protein (cupin superfamily)